MSAASLSSPRLVPAPVAALLALTLALAAVGCRESVPAAGAANDPVQAVAVLNARLRDNDLEGFARDAVPAELHPRLVAAWRSGHSRWPLEELPFDGRIPAMLEALSAENAETRLRKDYDRQFANAHREIRTAAQALSLFGVKYLQTDPTLSAEERAHYAQVMDALGAWGTQARLGDPRRARAAIARLTRAARQSGLHSEADFARLGMDRSLRRLGQVMAAVKHSLRDYGLDLDRSLDQMSLSLVERNGDRARVRMRYPLGERMIDAVVAVEQVDGHWYLSDFLRHARDAAAGTPKDAAPIPSLGTPPAPASPKDGDARPSVAPPKPATTSKPTSS